MAILTIEDFLAAPQSEIDWCKKQLGVKDDLMKYMAWLNSADGDVLPVTFTLGGAVEREPGIHPSLLSKRGTCKLKHYYSCMGYVSDEVNYTSTQLTYDLGKAAHAMLLTMLEDMFEEQFSSEVSLRDDRLMIVAHTDGRMVVPSYRMLLEIKTIKSGGSYGIETVQDRPMKENVRQLMTYMHCDDCPFGLLLYFCKNNSDIVEHPVVWDQKMWDELEGDCLQVVDAIENDDYPVPTVGYQCRDCGYRHICRFGKEHLSGRRQRPMGRAGR